MTAKLYQGSLHADVTISFKDQTPSWFVAGQLHNTQVAPLLQDLTGKTSKLQLTGRCDLGLNITTQGKKSAELLSHLSGSGRFALRDGSLEGIDLAFFVDTAAALINHDALPKRSSQGNTPFGQVTGTAIIKNGIVTTTDLSLDSPLYFAKGAGSIDLNNRSLDYRIDITAKAEAKTNKLLALDGKTYLCVSRAA